MITKIQQKKFTSKIINQSDRKKIILNLVLYYGFRIFVLVFGIIRTFLITIFLGITNYGLLNIMIMVAPVSLFLISACQEKSNVVLYKYALTNNYEMLNKIISEQMKEMRLYAFISIFFLAIMVVISYFFVNSIGLTKLIACLLVIGSSIALLSNVLILPYVQ